MTAHRTAAAAALAGVVPLVLLSLSAGPAQAHGAPTDPVSRVAACGIEGSLRDGAACRAAVAANGGMRFDAWDNLRVADVRGRDREVIPDGRLCSAGIGAFKGLDIGRADWPATKLKSGGDFTLTYRSTIAHRGTFQLYLTKAGYDSAARLRWDDLSAEPFATATDPVLRDGAYRISGRLPAGLTGRHVLYTVWRNTDTPDTYYSCSDVTLTSDTKPGSTQSTQSTQNTQGEQDKGDEQSSDGQQPTPGKSAPEQTPSQPSAGEASAQQPTLPQAAGQSASLPAEATAAADDDSMGMVIGVAAVALGLLALGTPLLLRFRRH